MPVAEYASNAAVRTDILRALEQIERFLDDEEALPATGTNEADAERSFLAARQALTSDDTWHALAELRRSIEVELRAIAQRREIEVPPRAGAGQLLRALERAEAAPPEVVQPLRYAVDVANRAIHGEDVSPGLAEEAFYTADRALAYFRGRP